MILTAKKRTVFKVAVMIVLLAMLIVGGTDATIASVIANKKLHPIYAVETNESNVSLTFDAAWGADKTLKIMDIAERYSIKITFFLVGFWIDKYPEIVKEIDKRGHLIGNHSTNHLHNNKLQKEEIQREIATTSLKIEQLIGKKPKFYRTPFGEYNNTLINIIEDMSMQIIQWDVDSLDWKGLTGSQIAERVLSKVKKGSVILFHNNSDHILEALPLILVGLSNKGLKGVKLDQLIKPDNYYIDNDGIQKTNNK